MLGSGTTDGCFGTVDLTKTVVENETLVSSAGMTEAFFVTVMTAEGCRKLDFTGVITVPPTKNTITTKVSKGDRDGTFIVYVTSTQAFYEEDNERLTVFLDG